MTAHNNNDDLRIGINITLVNYRSLAGATRANDVGFSSTLPLLPLFQTVGLTGM
jgi:hypothetical protein